ncbi:hypothetical protein BXZ70DRAFT_181953 [Cristinia sonorae]|uniref:Uncharacterized protein n=1 Tax=Cristinia sonorae TaxID=1940300 RepID=A0A8K0XPT0_9AGAR|nr:hypothetical protein BXZ70DRAFT_181953 [Cristinia sonorae]
MWYPGCVAVTLIKSSRAASFQCCQVIWPHTPSYTDDAPDQPRHLKHPHSIPLRIANDKFGKPSKDNLKLVGELMSTHAHHERCRVAGAVCLTK